MCNRWIRLEPNRTAWEIRPFTLQNKRSTLENTSSSITSHRVFLSIMYTVMVLDK